MVFPQAYHITFAVYLSRPPGSPKPHVDRDHNEYGAPLAPTDPEKEQSARDRAREDPVELTIEQRRLVERAIRDLADRYGWTIHAIAVMRDHVHVVITAPREGEALREAIKATASRWLNREFGKRTWWAEGGSAKYLWDNDYFANATDYVNDQREV
jgi:REP element-mobilizing transposase RayT